jgi:hypothetical protein
MILEEPPFHQWIPVSKFTEGLREVQKQVLWKAIRSLEKRGIIDAAIMGKRKYIHKLRAR